ncbi:hypothetical protein NA57DRAFT_52767 [Rhizodiscina lignyota]|uniref:C2H2-type domain-containing protein n=1 Tax=Rhizodiscina lignyota TaxID=1504668 RepID=A0A9P4MA17_9PEZI|nr:hypothetical protein NA57DRAFT_52767 [Rhizodiscina lignyota]
MRPITVATETFDFRPTQFVDRHERRSVALDSPARGSQATNGEGHSMALVRTSGESSEGPDPPERISSSVEHPALEKQPEPNREENTYALPRDGDSGDRWQSRSDTKQKLSEKRKRTSSPTFTTPPDRGSPDAYRKRHRIGAEDDQTNGDGEFICTIDQDCKDLTFNRRSEWKRHIEKHTRPYKCEEPNCDRLEGFTYGSGLTRHLREVHGKGANRSFFCPEANCKRHTGRPFSRTQNRDEHIRRVHSGPSLFTTSASRKEWTKDSARPSCVATSAETIEDLALLPQSENAVVIESTAFGKQRSSMLHISQQILVDLRETISSQQKQVRLQEKGIDRLEQLLLETQLAIKR